MLIKAGFPAPAVLSDEDKTTLEIAGAAFAARQSFDSDLPFRIVFGDGTFAPFETLDDAQSAWDAVEDVLTRPYWMAHPWYQMKFSPVRLEVRLGWVSVIR